jgi:hypothetical protein
MSDDNAVPPGQMPVWATINGEPQIVGYVESDGTAVQTTGEPTGDIMLSPRGESSDEPPPRTWVRSFSYVVPCPTCGGTMVVPTWDGGQCAACGAVQ